MSFCYKIGPDITTQWQSGATEQLLDNQLKALFWISQYKILKF